MSDEQNSEEFEGFDFELDISEMAQGAIQLHEFFTSLCEAGFTEAQALHLTTGLLTSAASND